MAIVAVAGGTGHLGRAIVEAILATGKHQVFVLSRKVDDVLAKELGTQILRVDYNDVSGLVKILEDNNIDSLISAIAMFPGPEGQPPELEIIRAADLSKTTKRMISSNWGIEVEPEHAERLPAMSFSLAAKKELEKTKNLEITYVLNGNFMDYWGMPGVKSYLRPEVMVIDIPNRLAALPGDGNTPVIMTHSSDVARFVAAALDLERWDRPLHVVGDRLTWNQILGLVETAISEKISHTYDTIEQLRAGNVTELPGQVATYEFFPKEAYQQLTLTFNLWFADGVFDYETGTTLNDHFPDIKAMTVREMLEKAWSKARP